MSENAGSIFFSVDIETDKTLRAQEKIDQGFDKLQKGMDDTDKSAQQLGGGLSNLALSIAAVVSAGAIREMAGLVQKYQEMAERVQMATSSQVEFEMVQKRLLNTANQTYRRLDEAQELYIRTADSLRSMGYSTEQALDVTDSLSFAFVKNATSMDRANNAISAVSKSINKGKVEADAWESLLAAVPTVIDDIASASGKTAAEIRALGAAGDITAAQLTEGLRKSLDENSKAAAGMAANLTDAGVRTRTALTAVLVSLEKQTGGLQAVTDGIIEAANVMLEFGGDAEKMAAFLDTATTAATALAAVLASRLLAALTGYGAALVAQAAASVQASRAAAANLQLAQAEAVAAANALMQAKASAQAAVGLSTHAAAVTALTAAESRATAATVAFTAAQAASTAAARVGTTVLAGLRGAMALLGGPAGVIFLAASALAWFVTSSTEAKPAADALTGSVNQLGTAAERAAERFQRLTTGIEKLNKTELSLRKGELETQLRNAEGQLKSFERQFERGVGSIGQVEGARAAVEELQRALEKLNGTKPADTEPTLTSGTGPAAKTPKGKTEAQKAADAIREQVAALELQSDTLGMTASELEIYRLQLAGATDEQIRAAQSSLSMIDAFEQQADAADASAKAEAERRKSLEQAAKTVTPMRAAENQYQTDLQQYQDMLALKLISDQEYMALKKEAETTYDAERLAAQEAMFASASASNAILMDAVNALGSSASTAFAGILSGTMNGEEALKSLANTIFQSVISSFVQMGIAQVKAALIGKAASASAAAGYVASVGGQVAATTALAAQAAFASTAAIPIVGPALAGPAAAAAGAAAAALGAPAIGAASATLAGGRALGGPVQANSMYRVNEGGKPEIFNAANGQQYMMPNQRGEVVSNKDAQGGGEPTVIVNIQNNASGTTATATSSKDDRGTIIDVVVSDIMQNGKIGQAVNRTTGTRRAGG